MHLNTIIHNSENMIDYIFTTGSVGLEIDYSSNPYHYSSICSYSYNVHIHGTTVLVPYTYCFQHSRLFLPAPAHHINEIESLDTACFHIHMLVTSPHRQSINTLLLLLNSLCRWRITTQSEATQRCWKDDLTLSPPTPSREKLPEAFNLSERSRKSLNHQLNGLMQDHGPGFHKSSTVPGEGRDRDRELEYMKQHYSAPRNSLRSDRSLHGLKYVSNMRPIESDTMMSDDAQTRCSDTTTLNWRMTPCNFKFNFASTSQCPIRCRTLLYCTVLYCTLLYCTVLYCTVLYWTILYCTVLYCTVLYCTVLYCSVLYCTALYITVLYCTVLYCTVLYCTVPYHTSQFWTTIGYPILCYALSWCSIIDRAEQAPSSKSQMATEVLTEETSTE